MSASASVSLSPVILISGWKRREDSHRLCTFLRCYKLLEIERPKFAPQPVFLQLKALLEPFGITRYHTDHWGAYARHLAPEQHNPGKRNTQKNGIRDRIEISLPGWTWYVVVL